MRELREGLEAAGLQAERRALRLPVAGLAVQSEGRDVWVRFTLRRGAFATSVLRELAQITADAPDRSSG